MTSEVGPQLPQIQTSIADLLESANHRFETTERSKWFLEMDSQMADFEASGYQCIETLRLGEDNPTEAEIDATTQQMVDECDVAVGATIGVLGGAMRRHAKAAADLCPVDSIGYIYDVARNVTEDDPSAPRAGRRIKPEVYGRIGNVIRDTVRLTFDRRADPALGEYGLYANSSRRPATANDVASWSNLFNCWVRTLQAGVIDVMAENHRRRDPGQIVLKSLFGMYRALYGHGPDDDVFAQRQLEDGCVTASSSCMRLAYAMDKYLFEDHGIVDPKRREIIISRSNGPIGKMAGLTLTQAGEFSVAYLGANSDPESVETDFTKIRTDMLKLGRNSRINFIQPMDELPLPNGLLLGKVDSIVRRIGCPILLTPRLIQGLWGSFVKSAAQAELI